MQLNNTELRLLEGVIPTQSLPSLFQLPALHASVPRTAHLVQYQTDFSELGRNLLAADVIDPTDISDTAVTPQQVVAEGLRAWFMRRIGGLEYMRFDVRILDAEAANSHIDRPQWEGKEFTGPSVAIVGGEAQLRYVEDVARFTEKLVPGLFLVAYSELISASYKTVEIQHPERILANETAYSLWGNDIDSISDEEARQELMDRFGEEDETVLDHYMPDAVLEAYGNGFCFFMATKSRPAPGKKKRPRFSNRRLRKLGGHYNAKIAGIAKKLLALRKAVARVKALKADIAHLHGLRCYWVACILLFNNDDRCSQYMDQEGQYLWENGEGTDLHSVEQLPATVGELATYFQQLDALFDLVSKMDALIPSLSYCAFAE
jgi:PRTRC genetic system protein F